MIRLRDLSVSFGAVEALRLESLDIDAGERVCVRGPNGSGKTTLLRVLAGLQRPTKGSIEGAPPPGRIVLVHQHPYLFRGTARENVTWGLRIHARPEKEADLWLERVGALHLAQRGAKSLSGGERRRIAVARAMAIAPEALLLDEPLAALDEDGAAKIVSVMEEFRGTLVVAAPRVGDLPLERTVDLSVPT